MNKRKAKEWLKSVTGRKIKLDFWDEGAYIIPTGEWGDTSDNSPYHWVFWAINERGGKSWWRVYNGFKEIPYDDKWELVETFEDYLEMYHNE